MINESLIIIALPVLSVAVITAAALYIYRIRRDFNLLLHLAHSVNEVFWITDRRWKKVYYISPAFEKVWGIRCEELYRSPDIILQSVHPDHRERIAESLGEARSLDKETRFPNFRIVLHDGSIKWIASRAFPVRDRSGRIVRVAGIAEDITGRVIAEEELSRNSRRYREIIDNIQEVVYRCDINGVLTMISPSVTKVLGYEKESECLGKNIAREMYFDSGESVEFARILREKGSVTDYEVTLKKKDGSPVVVSTNSHIYYNADGQAAGFEGIVRDITARKRAEELFNKAFMDNPTVMSVSDIATGSYVEINRAYTEVLGYARDEVVGHSVYELNIYKNPEDRQRVVEAIQKTGRAYNLEIEFMSKNGDVKTGLFFGEIIEILGKKMLLSSVLNITGQRQAEKAFRESEERFRRLAENAPDVIYRMRLADGVYEYVSPSVSRVLGLSAQQLYDNPLLVVQLIHPDWKDYFAEQWSQLQKGIVPPYYEYRIITLSGEEKWIHQRNMLITDESGRAVAIEGIVTDVSERKRIEAILRDSEKKLLEAEKIAQIGHWELHLDTQRIYGSAGARELYGLDAEYWDFSRIKDMALPEFRSALNAEMKALLENGKPYDIEFMIRRMNDGRILYVHSIAEFDPLRRIVFGTIQDISERKHAEVEVQKLKNYLANIIDSNPSILVGIDTGMNVTLLNRHAEKLINISSEQAVGMPLESVLGDFAPWIGSLKSDVISRSPAVIPDILIEKNGERHYYNLMLYPLAADGVEGAVVRIDDMTDSRRKEEQLIQAQKMENVGTLAGGLAHDFNNVLSGIIGTASLMKHKLDMGDPGRTQIMNWVDVIEHSSLRAADMVNRLLVLSRKHDVSLAPMDINVAVKNVMEICSNSFDKSIELSAGYSEGSAMIRGVPAQLEQVILNICVNASHAMTLMRPDGERKGGRLSIAVKRIVADRYFCAAHPEARPGAYWLISHSDTGVGMESSLISKIYDPFFTTKEKGEGTGLGLAMVYNIVHQHNGFIDVYSEKGVGSTFNIYLPEYVHTRQGAHRSIEQDIARGSGLILVIDDEEIVRLIAENILNECGYKVLLAESGKTGIDIFRAMHDEISAVLLDMAMPGLSGDDVFMELKKINPGVKVLLSSGFRQDSRVEKSMSGGVAGFIQKPYSIAEMSHKMKEVVDRQ